MFEVKISAERACWIIENWFCILTEGQHGEFIKENFVLRPYQRKVLFEVWEKNDINLLIEKTRQMGLSWLFAAVCVIWLLFGSNETVLVVGKNENLVDNAEVITNTFMGKIKYILRELRSDAAKLLVRKFIRAKYLHIINLVNGASITGAASAGGSGRGGTWSRVIWDEAAFTPHGEALFASISPNSKQLILVSTANGKNNVFFATKTKIESGEISSRWKIRKIHWKEFFDKAWYDDQCLRLGNDPTLIAQELDIDYDTSTKERVFYNFTDANFKKVKFFPAFRYSSCISFDFGIRDRLTGVVIQRNRGEDRWIIADCFELENVPFEKVLKALFEPDENALREIRGKAPMSLYPSFHRFYHNNIKHRYKELMFTGDPAANQRSQLNGQTIAQAIMAYTQRVMFYHSDVEPMLSFIRGQQDKIDIAVELEEMKTTFNKYSYVLNAQGDPTVPRHDKYSHLADGVRYGFVHLAKMEGFQLIIHEAVPDRSRV